MIEVELLIQGRVSIFVCDKVFEFLKSYENRTKESIENEAIYKLQKLVERGLERDEINIRHEGEQVFRIRLPRNGRIIGFFHNSNFIAINCFKKPRQKLNKDQKKYNKTGRKSTKFM